MGGCSESVRPPVLVEQYGRREAGRREVSVNALEQLIRLYARMAALGGLLALLAFVGFFVPGIPGPLCAAGLAVGLSTLSVGVWARRRGQKMVVAARLEGPGRH